MVFLNICSAQTAAAFQPDHVPSYAVVTNTNKSRSLFPEKSEEWIIYMQMLIRICMQTRVFVANEYSLMLFLLHLRSRVEETQSCAEAYIISSEQLVQHRAAVMSKFHSTTLLLLFFPPCF